LEQKQQVGQQVWQKVRQQVGQQVEQQVGQQVRQQVEQQVGQQVEQQVGQQVRQQVWQFVYPYLTGQFDASYLSFYDYINEELNVKFNKHWQWYKKTSSVGLIYPLESICVICNKPKLILFDNQNRLHSLDSPAILYPDGWGIYAVHGIRVPEGIIKDKKSITVSKIETEQNAEIRRVMIELYGQAEYLQQSGAKLIHSDNLGKLWLKEITEDEPMVMVQVKNSTPELDGTFKDYFLRVPPNMKNASEAVAWTFGMKKQQYNPLIQT
jgi:hypothetical protein